MSKCEKWVPKKPKKLLLKILQRKTLVKHYLCSQKAGRISYYLANVIVPF